MIIKYSCCLQSLVVLCRFSVSALEVLAMRADFVVDVGARRRRVDSAGRGSQRRALADRFRAALALRPCPLLQVGVEDVFVQFGPVVVVHDLVMVLAVVTDRYGRRRAVDHLAADEVPHLTVGRLAVGGGWVRSLGMLCGTSPMRLVLCRTARPWSGVGLFSSLPAFRGWWTTSVTVPSFRRLRVVRSVFALSSSTSTRASCLSAEKRCAYTVAFSTASLSIFALVVGGMLSRPGRSPTTARVSLRTSRVSILVPCWIFLPRCRHLSLRRRSLRGGAAAAGAGSRGSGVEIPLHRASSCFSSSRRIASRS